MADFRVSIQQAMYQTDAELDWNENDHTWTRSEKEPGLTIDWTQGLAPTKVDLKALSGFFAVDLGDISYERILSLSPGELTLLHRNAASSPKVLAILCPECFQHWIILKLGAESNEWLAYGRTCDFTWRRGRPVSEKEKEFILSITE